LKQIKIANPTVRSEGAIISDIADAQTAIGAAQQELAGLEDRRAAMLASGTIDEIYALADSVTRAKLKIEIAESRLDALNKELRRFYAAAAQAAVDAAMAPLAAIDAEERAAIDLMKSTLPRLLPISRGLWSSTPGGIKSPLRSIVSPARGPQPIARSIAPPLVKCGFRALPGIKISGPLSLPR
jgi:hypothetical protein